MNTRFSLLRAGLLPATFLLASGACQSALAAGQSSPADDFRTSTGCLNCHSAMTSSHGEVVSIGADWRGGMMANSARDPYWQASVRREASEHPELSSEIQTECASCHMPLQYQIDQAGKHLTEVLKRVPFHTADNRATDEQNAAAADGVSCAVCHQIAGAGLGTPASYNGHYQVAAAGTDPRPVYGPLPVDADTVAPLHVAASGYTPLQVEHIREAGLCGSCHTLTTVSRGPGGRQIGTLPEQMPFVEWLHSSYRETQTCQQCHMPAVEGTVEVASVAALPQEGVRRHSFTGANFLVESMLATHATELGVEATQNEIAAARTRITDYLSTQAATLTLGPIDQKPGQLSFPVTVVNRTGHKLPTAFPSRRAWLHVTVADASGKLVFESGRLRDDGSIEGNANDLDPTRYSPHYAEITQPDQVQIYEPILGDSQGHATTALLSATQYLKDNRILPAGMDKQTAPAEIAVHGKAATDAGFTAGQATTRYTVRLGAAKGPLRVTAELLYQPIGYRWAQNFAALKTAETERFVGYYRQAAGQSALRLARAEASR